MDHELSANRLVNELMLVSVLVAGQGAEGFAAALQAAGAAAEVFSGAPPQGGEDLAILLAPQDAASDTETRDLVATLSQASERLLFVPLPADQGAGGDESALPELTSWFEVFAELGYQPVVDFDAGFVAVGAFLVDRAATAAESELAAFAERLQTTPPPPAPREPAPPQDAALEAELASLRAQLAEQATRAASIAAQAERAETALHEAHASNAGWDGLRAWVNAAVRDPARDNEAALLRDLPRLNALRDPESPVSLVPGTPAAKPGLLARLFGRRTATPPSGSALRVLEDTALVRASPYFDPAWYVASSPELCADEAIDPVFHYVFIGAVRGADPGPWFDTAAYLADHPDAVTQGQSALVHALRAGTLPPHPPT